MVYSCFRNTALSPSINFCDHVLVLFRGAVLSRGAEVIRSHLMLLNGVFLAGWCLCVAAAAAEEPSSLNSAVLLGGSEQALMTGELPGMMDGAGATPERESSDLYEPSCNNSITQPP